VETVFTGPGGLIDGLARDQVVIDMSTISPSASRRFAALVEAKGASALDAPVSGGVSGAESGRLSIMVGGAPEVLEKVRRVLEVLGTTITYVGGPGAGQAAKLCNQVVVALNLQAVCEGFSLGRGLGLDLETLRQILAGGSAGSWMLDNLAPKMILDDTAAGFRIDLQIKDLRLALEASMEAAIPLPGMSLATSLFVETKAHGEGRFGNQALYRAYERLSNRPWRDGPASPSPATISNGEDAA
jgi:2-hydroxy-3-oxopropionate reductase